MPVAGFACGPQPCCAATTYRRSTSRWTASWQAWKARPWWTGSRRAWWRTTRSATPCAPRSPPATTLCRRCGGRPAKPLLVLVLTNLHRHCRASFRNRLKSCNSCSQQSTRQEKQPRILCVTQVTLIPRGQARGLTWFTPGEDPSLISKSQIFARIVSALGGRAAEQVIFGDPEITTGASGDLQQVRAAVAEGCCNRAVLRQ